MELTQLAEQLIEFSLNLLLAILIFFIGKWLVKKLISLVQQLMKRHDIDTTVASFAGNIVHILLLALVVIVALTQLGIPTASFIAILGAAGLAIGLALQSSLSNFASGILLVLFHPIKLGDYIEAGGASGSVEAINVFSTTLITPDKRSITVPNALVMGGPIINYSSFEHRRIDLLISVPYECDLAQVKQTINSVVSQDSRVLKNKSSYIGVSDLGSNAVEIAVWPWVLASDYLHVKSDLQENLKQELEKMGVKLPVPQMEVSVGGSANKLLSS